MYLTLWLVCVLGWAAVILSPDRYLATARVQVDATSTLAPVLGRQIVVADVREQVELVRQALLGSVQLERVARETGLDSEVITDSDRVNLVNNLRESISIAAARQGSRTVLDNLYIIEYEHTDRNTAISVVSVLLNSFIEESLSAKRAGDNAAREFIESQIAENEGRLRDAETRLAEFKKANADRLPGSEGGYFDRLSVENEELAELQRDLRIARSKRDRLVEQLSGETSAVLPGVIDDEDIPENSIDARIREYEARLEELLLDYTEKHPDVIALRETLGRLKAEREEMLSELGVSGNQQLSALSSNPVHQAIQISLNETEVQIATLEADIADQVRLVANLQRLIDEVPEVEAELARLNRDYEVIYEGYQELVQSRETHELSSRAYDSDKVDFEVIDPPVADFEPVAPNRPLLLLFVAVVACGLAAGTAFVLSQLTPVFHDARSLRELTGLPVLGSVGTIATVRQGVLHRSDFRAFIANLAALGIVFVGLIAIEVSGPGLRELMAGVL